MTPGAAAGLQGALARGSTADAGARSVGLSGGVHGRLSTALADMENLRQAISDTLRRAPNGLMTHAELRERLVGHLQVVLKDSITPRRLSRAFHRAFLPLVAGGYVERFKTMVAGQHVICLRHRKAYSRNNADASAAAAAGATPADRLLADEPLVLQAYRLIDEAGAGGLASKVGEAAQHAASAGGAWR